MGERDSKAVANKRPMTANGGFGKNHQFFPAGCLGLPPGKLLCLDPIKLSYNPFAAGKVSGKWVDGFLL